VLNEDEQLGMIDVFREREREEERVHTSNSAVVAVTCRRCPK